MIKHFYVLEYVLQLLEFCFQRNSSQLIWRAFSVLFQGPSIFRESKFAPQEYEKELQKYSRLIGDKTIGFPILQYK